MTLGTLSMCRGLGLVSSDAQPIAGVPRDHAFFNFFGGSKLGIPVSILVFVLVAVALTVVLKRTRYGVMVRAIGASEKAARFSGIPIGRIRLYTLMLVGTLCGISGC